MDVSPRNFVCDVCDRGFKLKGHLKAHKAKKRPCLRNDLLQPGLATQKMLSQCLKDIVCPYCQINFTRRNNLVVHIKTACKALGNRNKTAIANSLKDFVWDAELFEFGHLRKYRVSGCINEGVPSLSKIVALVHFNRYHKTFYNVYIDPDTGLGMYFSEGEWHAVEPEALIDRMWEKAIATVKKIGNMESFKGQVRTTRVTEVYHMLDTLNPAGDMVDVELYEKNCRKHKSCIVEILSDAGQQICGYEIKDHLYNI